MMEPCGVEAEDDVLRDVQSKQRHGEDRGHTQEIALLHRVRSSESNDGALGRESAPVSADQSGEDRREYGGPEDRIMVHVIRNEKTVAHADKRIHHGEIGRASCREREENAVEG